MNKENWISSASIGARLTYTTEEKNKKTSYMDLIKFLAKVVAFIIGVILAYYASITINVILHFMLVNYFNVKMSSATVIIGQVLTSLATLKAFSILISKILKI